MFFSPFLKALFVSCKLNASVVTENDIGLKWILKQVPRIAPLQLPKGKLRSFGSYISLLIVDVAKDS